MMAEYNSTAFWTYRGRSSASLFSWVKSSIIWRNSSLQHCTENDWEYCSEQGRISSRLNITCNEWSLAPNTSGWKKRTSGIPVRVPSLPRWQRIRWRFHISRKEFNWCCIIGMKQNCKHSMCIGSVSSTTPISLRSLNRFRQKYKHSLLSIPQNISILWPLMDLSNNWGVPCFRLYGQTVRLGVRLAQDSSQFPYHFLSSWAFSYYRI